MPANNIAVKRAARKENKKRFVQGFDKSDPEDRSAFIEHHLPLVISIAKKRAGQGVDFEDLVQEGTVGLITASEKFDPSKGFRFSTYATWWIRQAIDEAVLKQGDTVKKPSNYASHLKNLLRISRQLEKKLGREPSYREVSEGAEMDQNMVKQLLSLIPGTVSLDAPISDVDDSASKYLDVLEDRDAESPDDASMADNLKNDLYQALDTLSDKEKRIIEMRFGLVSGETMSLREIGKVFELSPERIRQIEEGAINKLKNSATHQYLHEYLN